MLPLSTGSRCATRPGHSTSLQQQERFPQRLKPHLDVGQFQIQGARLRVGEDIPSPEALDGIVSLGSIADVPFRIAPVVCGFGGGGERLGYVRIQA